MKQPNRYGVCREHRRLLHELKEAQRVDKRAMRMFDREAAANAALLKKVNKAIRDRSLYLFQAEWWMHGERKCFGCAVDAPIHRGWIQEIERLCLPSSISEQGHASGVAQVVGESPAGGSTP